MKLALAKGIPTFQIPTFAFKYVQRVGSALGKQILTQDLKTECFI